MCSEARRILEATVLVAALGACGPPGDTVSPSAGSGQAPGVPPAPPASAPATPPVGMVVPVTEPGDRRAERESMVERQVATRGIHDAAVLDALRSVPRHQFVPLPARGEAYSDRPLPIGFDQTISQPYIVALMTELAEVQPGDRVLEIGTGSGYQAAVLASMGCTVFTIEIVNPLAERAAETLERLGYGSIQVRAGDGYVGWPEEAPFDAILVTAAPPRIPQPLLDQLADGGHLVAPVGEDIQHLTVVTRAADDLNRRVVLPVRFVPMTGEVRRIRDTP
jgi:protein-L-isoaspartate(D-aspartate) O-methyltransferase